MDIVAFALISCLFSLIICFSFSFVKKFLTDSEDPAVWYVQDLCPPDPPAASAGVDYEWLAGVFLFGILLYCLMRLLGGVLK